MTAKQVAMEILAQLPDDCTYEDIEYQFYIHRTLEEAQDEIDRGDFVDHEEVVRQVKARRRKE